MLTLDDFISDYQHLVVRNMNKDGQLLKNQALAHVEKYYTHCKAECLDFLNRKS